MKSLFGLITVALISTSSVNAQEAEFDIGSRWRLQHISDDVRGNSTANTLLLRADSKVEFNESWQAMVQLDHVFAFNKDNYNSVTHWQPAAPIPDPHGFDINQVWLMFDAGENGQITAGRQALTFADGRHIGGNSFWQNEQTFDAVRWHIKDELSWSLDYVFINKANRIHGRDADAILPPSDPRFQAMQSSTTPSIPRHPLELGEHKHNSHVLHVNYHLNRNHQLSAYGYFLDNQTFRAHSSRTLGVKFQGSQKPGKIKFQYNIEAAQQQDANQSPWDYAPWFFKAELGAQYRSHQWMVSFERLEEDNGFGFIHSLGSHHQFLGWADIFGGYNGAAGIDDLFITYRGRDGKLRWKIVAHQFKSQRDNVTIGNELDIEVAYRFNRDWEIRAFMARYVPDEGLLDLQPANNDLTSSSVALLYHF